MSTCDNSVLNPLIFVCDQHLISPYNITPVSKIWVKRMKKNDHQLIVAQFSLSAPQGMYRELYAEYTYCFYGVKGYMTIL